MGILSFFRNNNHRDTEPGYWPHNDGYQSWTPITQGTRGNPWQTMNAVNPTTGDLPEAAIMPHVRAIAARFAALDFKAVDIKTGKDRIVLPRAVQYLNHPNAQHTRTEFLHHIAQQVLLRPHVDVLVWHDTGKDWLEPAYDRIFPDLVAGYTILPTDARVYNADGTYYLRYTIQGFEAVALPAATINLTYQLDPNNPYEGLAAADTVRAWADIDALMADYERGFFTQGAVPRGTLSIVAPSPQAFETVKGEIDKRFRGKGKHGIVYNYTPVDPATGSPAAPKISWTPFQQSNDSLDLSTLSDVVDRRLAQGIAVPEIIRGLDTGQTYANAEQAVKTFIDSTLAPLAKRICERFTFDIETGAGLPPGGLGWRLEADLPEVALSEARRTEAEVKRIEAETWAILIQNGMSHEDAVRVLKLEDWEGSTLEAVPDDVSRETLETPAALPVGVTVQNQLPAPTPQAEAEAAPHVEMLQLTEQARLEIPANLARRIADIIQQYTPAALDGGNSYNEAILDLSDELYSELEPYIVNVRNATAEDILELARAAAPANPIIADSLASYSTWESIPEAYRHRYTERVSKISRDLMEETTRRVQSTTLKAEQEGWNRETTEAALNQVLDDPRRAELIARNEIVNTGRIASQVSAEEMSHTLHVPLLKKWNTTSGDPCEFCTLMDGTVTHLDDAYMEQDVTVELPSGAVFANTWQRMETTDAHPNCQCVQTYEVDWSRLDAAE